MPYLYDFEKVLLVEKSIIDEKELQEELHNFAACHFKVSHSHIQIIGIKRFKEISYYIETGKLKIGLNLKFLSVYNRASPGQDSYYLVIEDLSKRDGKSIYHAMHLKENKLTIDEFKEALRACFHIFVNKVQLLTKATEILAKEIHTQSQIHKNFLLCEVSDPYTYAYEEKISAVSVYRNFTIQALNKDENFTINLDVSEDKKIIAKIYDIRFDEKLNVFSKEYKKVFEQDPENHKELEHWCGKIVAEEVQSMLYNCYSF